MDRDESLTHFSPMSLENLLTTNLLSISTMTLGTTGQDGEPHAAPLYFVADEQIRLYFFSDPESQHGQDLANNPYAAVTIYPECFDWEDIRGLQMRGVVYQVERGAQWDEAWIRYADKFPFVASLKDIIHQNNMYVFSPSWVRLVDNRQGFGYKQEWTLS